MAIVAGAVIFFLLPRVEPEPIYKGRRLSEWLRDYGPTAKVQYTQAYAALRAAGTNAIPTLLRMLGEKDSRWKLQLIAAAKRFQLTSLPNNPALRDNFLAVWGFPQLGTQAIALVPVSSWIAVYERHPSALSQSFVARTLGDRGQSASNAVPALLQVATNTNTAFALRIVAFEALCRIRSRPDLVVPALVRATHDRSPAVRETAIDGLGEFGPDAKSADDALMQILAGPDITIRAIVFEALEKIDPAAAARARQANSDGTN